MYFKRAHESNESITKANLEVALLVAKHSKPFEEGEFVKTCVMKMAEQICPQKKKDFANVCLARNTVAWRIEELSTDVRKQLGEKSLNFDFFSLACDESTDLSDTTQLLIFLKGVFYFISFFYLFSFLLTINLKIIIVHVETKL